MESMMSLIVAVLSNPGSDDDAGAQPLEASRTTANSQKGSRPACRWRQVRRVPAGD
jgi:hypothetical protein